MIEIQIQLFGAFRKYELPGQLLTLSFPEPVTVEKVKQALAIRLQERFPGPSQEFTDSQLILDSAIADEKQILATEVLVDHSCVLAILPPVCGG